MLLTRCVAGAGLSLLLGTTAWAQSSNNLPLWELGAVAVGVSQQAYPGSAERAQQALALPFFIYRGEVLRLDGGNAGLRAFKTPTWELDIGASGSLGSRASDTVAACAGTSAGPHRPTNGAWTCHCAACLTSTAPWRSAASLSSRS